MYVTRPLSLYRNHPCTLSIAQPEAPNSGYLVITDEESESQETCCWGICKNTQVKKLPFPQNNILNVVYSSGTRVEENGTAERVKVWFIPVLDQPLSSNRYYVIRAKGKYKGKACTCSRKEDMGICCFCNYVKDIKPRPFNHRDIYQQVEIRRCHGGFVAKSIASDGFPPLFLRRKGWEVYTSSSHNFRLGDAQGLDISLRMRLPEFNFPISVKCSRTVVGKWYCPCMFIKEMLSMKDQMKKSMFYEITLEQWWEEIYTCENDNSSGNVINVNVSIQREVAMVLGVEAVKDDRHEGHGVVWFSLPDHSRRRGLKVGLSVAIVEKMKWVEEIGGWINGEEREVSVLRVEEFTGENGWNKFGCYVLVERFSLRRRDGSFLLTYDFKHTHQIKSKWE